MPQNRLELIWSNDQQHIAYMSCGDHWAQTTDV